MIVCQILFCLRAARVWLSSFVQFDEWSDYLICILYLCLIFVWLDQLIVFDNPKMASLFAVIFWLAALFAGSFAYCYTESGKTWFCLLSPACMNISITNLTQYEPSLIGLQFDNIFDEYSNFRFETSIIMFYVDYVLYLILAMYFDRAWPSRYGSKLPFYFFVSPKFWRGCCGKNESRVGGAGGGRLLNAGSVHQYDLIDRRFSLMDTNVYEPVSDRYKDKQPFVAIRHLRKHFEPLFGGDVVKAVDGVSLDMYEGQVFCLLGHNGAGKTTTIGMLS